MAMNAFKLPWLQISNSMITPHFTTRNGFTLAEIVVATIIAGLLTLSFGTFLVISTRSQRILGEQSDAIREADAAIEILTDYLREVRDGDNGAYAIAEADDYSLTAYANIDDESDVERLRIYIDDTNLLLEIAKPSGTPAVYSVVETKNVAQRLINETVSRKPVFQYYGHLDTVNGTPLANPVQLSDIRMIEIQLDVNVNPDVIPSTTEVSTYVRPRNISQ